MLTIDFTENTFSLSQDNTFGCDDVKELNEILLSEAEKRAWGRAPSVRIAEEERDASLLPVYYIQQDHTETCVVLGVQYMFSRTSGKLLEISTRWNAPATGDFEYYIHQRMWKWLANHPECDELDFVTKNMPLWTKNDLAPHNFQMACRYAFYAYHQGEASTPDPAQDDLESNNRRCRFCPFARKRTQEGKVYCMSGWINILHTIRGVRKEVYPLAEETASAEAWALVNECDAQIRSICLSIAELPVLSGIQII